MISVIISIEGSPKKIWGGEYVTRIKKKGERMPLASLNREFSGSLILVVRQWIVVMRNPSRFRRALVAWSPILDDRTRTVAFCTGLSSLLL
jgi:hypothetical protein